MSAAVWNEQDAEPTYRDPVDGRPSAISSLAAVLALVGIAVAIGSVDLLLQGQTPSWAAALASWDWVVNVILVILALVIVFMVVRTVFRGVGVRPHEYARERHARRRGHAVGTQSRDPAVEIARTRYARGEIGPEQLNETLRQLGKSS